MAQGSVLGIKSLLRLDAGAQDQSEPSQKCDHRAFSQHTRGHPSRRIRFSVPCYGSTSEAGPLVGMKPLAKVGPTVQVLLDWLYSSE